MKRVTLWAAGVVCAGVIVWSAVLSDRERDSDRAIAAVVAACSTGSRIEVSRRVVEAELTFRDAPMSIRGELPARLENRMREVGCYR